MTIPTIEHRWDGDICLRCGTQAPPDGQEESGCPAVTAPLARLLKGELQLVSYDTETHLIQPGLLAPPLVCGSTATMQPGSEALFAAADARKFFKELLQREDVVVGGANIPYDFGVHSADEQRQVESGASPPPPGASFVELIFKLLDDGRAIDTHILEPLHDNALGRMFTDNAGKPINRYSLGMLEERYLGLDRSAEKKGENAWRLKYATLEHLPLEEWPPDAIGYPKRDARGTIDVQAIQLGLKPNPNAPEQVRQNLQCNTLEMRAAWFLHLACMWGMRTDPVMVDSVVGEITRKHEESRRKFFAEGLVRVRPCTKKKDKDTGISQYEDADTITAEWLDEAAAAIRARAVDNAWVPERLVEIEKAKDILATQPGRGVRFAEDQDRVRELVTRAYLGNPPMTSGGESGNQKVSINRDTLTESGDPLLEEYGEAGPNEKLFVAFTGVLTQGTTVPINPESNTIVTSGRTSYRKPNLQQLPKKGGIRECFVPRPGTVYCSVDYASLELCTGSDFQFEMFGRSTMGDAINTGQDLHCRIGARVVNVTYEEFLKRKKEPYFADTRNAMKEVNYGLGGKMGPPKLVLTARKKGLYFCELAHVVPAGQCGKSGRTTEYRYPGSPKVYPITPTCVECLKLAEKYKELWFEEFPEWHDYHELTDRIARDCDRGIPLESMGEGMLRLEGNPQAVANHYFQNPAAQGAKHAGWLLSKEAYTDRKSVLFNNLRVVVFVHDENISEIREEVAHECALRKTEIMIKAMQQYCRRVKISAEPALARRWFKGMEPAFTKAKRLRPWWPKDWKWEPDQALKAADEAM